MSLFSFLSDKIINRVRQYGLRSAAVQIARAAMRPLVRTNHDLVFIIPDFQGYKFRDPCISSLTLERIKRAAAAGELNESQVRLLSGFIEEGSQGVYAEVEGKLAGFAWVQLEGKYRFGPFGRLQIPPNHANVKYLMVFPQYRGCKLGQKLNAARLAMIPAGRIPVGFIIPENRFAIRNWEAFGFQRVIQVRQIRWLKRHPKYSVSWLTHCDEAESLHRALVEANCG